MIILTVRTDNPEAEIGLYNDNLQVAYETWAAHRQLGETLNLKIQGLLTSQNLSLDQVQAIACFQGPGSFTGLRIGLTVANALAYALSVPIIAQMDSPDSDWQGLAVARLLAGETDTVAMPEYGAEANITLPKQTASP